MKIKNTDELNCSNCCYAEVNGFYVNCTNSNKCEFQEE